MQLQTKSIEELRLIASKLDIKVHHMAKGDTIIKQIESQSPHRVEGAIKQLAMDEKNSPPLRPDYNTPEDIDEAIKPYLKDGFLAKYDDETWQFSYRGATDTGHLTMPMRLIKQKAEIVSRGARALRAMGRDNGDKTYAGNILSA